MNTETETSASKTTGTGNKSKGFSTEEQAAIKERAKEMKAQERTSKNRAEGESKGKAM